MMNLWNEINQSSWTQRFVWLNVVLFVAGALVVPKLASTTFTLLALTGIVFLVRERWPMDLSRAEKWLLLAFALYFIVGVASYSLGIKTRLGWEIIFRDIRFLFAIPVYLILRRYPPPASLVWLAVLVSAFILCIDSLGGYIGAGGGWRAEGATISIVFGNLAVSVALVCASSLVFLHVNDLSNLFGTRKYKLIIWQLLYLVGVLAAAVAVALSGTRGALAALVGIGSLLLFFWWFRTRWQWRLASIFVIVIIAMVAALCLHKPLVFRMQNAIDSWNDYQSKHASIAALSLPKTGCVNNPIFLRIYADNIHLSSISLTDINVVDMPVIKAKGCSASSVIKLHNHGKRADWVALPWVNQLSSSELAHVMLLTRGQGSIKFWGTPSEARTYIDSETYIQTEVIHAVAGLPNWPVIWLDKGETLYIVPVQIVPGEYTMFYTDSSIGSRLQMWSAAWQVFLTHPALGAGTGAWRESTVGLIQSGTISPVVARFDHAHNDYLTALADRGLLGFASLMLLYGAPFWLFVRALRQTGSRAEPVAGLLLIGGFMLSGLTETLFNHSLVITYYAVFISLLAVMSRRPASIESG